MAETLAHGCSSESTQRELSNAYQHDRVKLVIKNFASLCLDEDSLSIRRVPLKIVVWISDTFDYYFEINNDFIKYLKESCR